MRVMYEDVSCRSLGALNYVRVWHDNSGEAALASWFLKYMIVRDLQTMQKSYFICQRWLAVEKDDGAVSASLTVNARKGDVCVGGAGGACGGR